MVKEHPIQDNVKTASILIGIVLLTIIGFGIGEVVAQETGEVNTTLEANSPQQTQIDLIARSDSTVEVGETVALGFPKDEFLKDSRYQWEVTEGPTKDEDQLLHKGTAEIDESVDVDNVPEKIPPHNARVTSFRPSKPGTYVIEGTVSGETYSTQIKATHTEIGRKKKIELLKKYAPVLNFHPEENYRPTRIEAFFENSYLCDVRFSDNPRGPNEIVRYVTVSTSANLYDIPVGDGTDSMYLQQYPLAEQVLSSESTNSPCEVNSLRQGFTRQGGLLEEYDPQNTDYPETVYANVVKNVNFNPSDYQNHVEDYENAGFEPPINVQGENYTALAYWMVYMHDPKPHDERSFNWLSGPLRDINFQSLAGHTGDIEPIFILLNNNNNPEWVLASQHKGGEYRKWENVEREGSNPIMYPADGSHSNFFGTSGVEEIENTVRSVEEGKNPEYVYQAQYLKEDERGTFLAEKLPIIPLPDDFGVNILYTDLIGYNKDISENILRPTDYDIAVLTGNETWAEHQGDIFRYSNPSVPKVPFADGSIPQQQDRFYTPGQWAKENLNADVSKTPTGFLEPNKESAQINAELSDSNTEFVLPPGVDPEDASELDENIQEDIILPDGRDIECAESFPSSISCDRVEAPPPVVAPNQIEDDPELIGWAEADGNIGVNVINTGMQPHDFTLDLSATDLAPENQADYSFYVNSIFPKNVAGAYVPLSPLEITESDISEGDGDGARDITFDSSLWMYPDDYELDDHSFKLRLTDGLPEPSLEIDEEETIDAGTVNESRMVKVDVSVEGRDQLSGDYEWSVTVGGEEASFYDDGSPLTVYEGDGEYRIVFYAPEKEEPETYDVEVELETEDEELSDTKEDLLSYSDPGGVSQTATALVLDTSGSMGARDVGSGNRMGAAKEAALGVVERQSDFDYVSVVGFSSGSSVKQGLTRLDGGRAGAESAIGGLRQGGFTNIGAGLSDGIDEVMKAPEGAQKNVILMSDGGRNRGPGEAAIRSMVRNRMNPNGVCLQTNSLGDGADVSFMNSLADTADCSKNTVSDSRDEIIEDFIDLARDFDASELVKEIEDRVEAGETFEDTFEIDEGTTNVILDVAKNTHEMSGLRAQDTKSEIDVDDNRSDAELNFSGTSVESLRTGTLDRPAPEERDVRLYSPDGSIVNPENSSDVEVSSTDDRTVYRINDPEAGEWSYEIDGGEGGTDFEVVITADSLTKMNVETSSDEYYTGTDAVLTATVFGAEPVTDANVEAEVEAPDGSSKTVTLDEVSPGIYRTTVDLEEGVSGTYEATVKATKDEENVERRATVNWKAEYAAPVSVGQPNVPVVEPRSEGETELTVESEALLGIRSVELGVSEFTHETSNATIPGSRVSMNRSHLIQSGETVPVETTVSVPSDAPTGTYTAEASAVVDNSGTTVDEVEIRVGGGTDCVDRRDAGRGETAEHCSDRGLSRGYERAPDRNDRGSEGRDERRSRGR